MKEAPVFEKRERTTQRNTCPSLSCHLPLPLPRPNIKGGEKLENILKKHPSFVQTQRARGVPTPPVGSGKPPPLAGLTHPPPPWGGGYRPSKEA